MTGSSRSPEQTLVYTIEQGLQLMGQQVECLQSISGQIDELVRLVNTQSAPPHLDETAYAELRERVLNNLM